MLIDEKAGRAVAMREGLSIVGLVGVLVAAKQKGLVASVKPLLEKLETEAGFRLAQDVKRAAIKASGESSS